MPKQGSRASFGVDAPVAPLGMGAVGAAAGLAAVALRRRTRRRWPAILAASYSALFGVSTAIYLHTTLRGKLAAWEDILDELALGGDERVLDLGCGRGAVLLAVARRLPRGTAIGVDLWRAGDQSGNNADATRHNARALGLDDQVVLLTADMADLPLADRTVDVVVSNLAIHNITDPVRRARAVREAVRVLRPGGRMALVDFRHIHDYERELVDAGMTDVHHRALGWRFWYGGPWGGAHLLSATRPTLAAAAAGT